MVEAGKYLEEIAAAVGREVNSIRGKLLSMGLKVLSVTRRAQKQMHTKASKTC